MIYKGIKTIVWDLDGTLIDSFSVFSEVTQHVLKAQGYAVPTLEKLSENFHGSLEDSIRNSAGGLTDQQLEAVMAQFLDVQNGYYEAIEHHIFTDAIELAKRAKSAGIMQTIVTNRMHEGRLNASPRNIVANSSLKELVDSIICGDDGPHRKPLVAIFNGEAPGGEHTLVIGDQFVDVQLAYNLGAKAAIVNRGSATLQHAEKLHDDWQTHTEIVASLDEVQFA